MGNSVQKLIEKFDDPSRVVLRGPKKPQIIPRHSDDLNKLLEELAKVTCAPIMTPGATSSLVNPNLTDAEVSTNFFVQRCLLLVLITVEEATTN